MGCCTCSSTALNHAKLSAEGWHTAMAPCARAQVENPKPEDVECLCKLLSTIGVLLDASKGAERMDVYFLRLNRLKDNPTMEARHRFMIQARGCCGCGAWSSTDIFRTC